MRMLRDFPSFLADLYVHRDFLMTLTRRDFVGRWLGSRMGLAWAFIHPTATIFILWLVFEHGFNTGPVEGKPFVVWLTAGMVPWLFFAEALAAACNSVLEHSYLVKKIVFRFSMLPLVKILSSLVVHLFLVAVAVMLCMIYGLSPDLHALQIPYYIFSSIILLLGLSWLTSSMVLFLKDVAQVVAVALQFGFWLTPVLWSVDLLPQQLRVFAFANPAHYIVQGFRDALLNEIWFWERPLQTLYFWAVASVVFALGAVVFNRLRPHFADVL